MTTPSNGEVTILCLTDQVHLQDIGVHLTRGHRASVSLSQAMKSRDLSAAKLDGTVAIQATRAAATVRAQEYTSSDTTHSQARRHSPAPPADVLATLGDLAGEVREVRAIVLRLTDEVRGIRADLHRLMQQPSPQVDLSRVMAKLDECLANPARVVRGTPEPIERRGTPHVEEPSVFIPSNLTGGMAAQELRVASETSEIPQLTGTAEALKAARKKR